MRSCPLFEHLLSPSLTDDIFQITNKQENCMEEKYFQVKKYRSISNIKQWFVFQAYNESQRNVISEAVSMIRDTKDDNQPKIYMCQGPPGTGNRNVQFI